MSWQIPSGLYSIIWSAMLLHCLISRAPYPPFGPRWCTRVIWLVTFVFYNPVLTFLYFTFNFLLRRRETPGPGRSIGFDYVIAIAVVLVLFEYPFPACKAERIVVLNESVNSEPREQEDSFSESGAHLGILWAEAKVVIATSVEGDPGVSPRDIFVFCQNPHPLLDRVARRFQKSLAQNLPANKITYCPFGVWPEPSKPSSGIFIVMNMPKIGENTLPCSRRIETVIQWRVGHSTLTLSSGQALEDLIASAEFSVKGKLDHESTMFGIESPRAKYKLEANSICDEMFKRAEEQLKTLVNGYVQSSAAANTLPKIYCQLSESGFVTEVTAGKLIPDDSQSARNVFWQPRLLENQLQNEIRRNRRKPNG